MTSSLDTHASPGPSDMAEAIGGSPSGAADPAEPTVVAASDLVAACEAAWAAIQARHPQLPDTVIVLGTGVERGRLVKLGHWWGGQWRVGSEARGEVLLAGEALHLSPEAVFEVLLHEAAHGLNAARGVRDASRGGRYHNANFKAAASEVGLTPARMDPYGWARTVLSADAGEAYAEAITGIGVQMRLARGLPARSVDRDGTERAGKEEVDVEGDGVRPKQRAAECGCRPGRKLRMAPSVLAKGPVLCGLCGAEFTLPVEAEHRVAASPQGVEPSAETTAAALAERSAEVTGSAFVHPSGTGAAETADGHNIDLRSIDLPADGPGAQQDPPRPAGRACGPDRSVPEVAV